MRRIDPTPGEMKETFESIDENGSGSIEFAEFTGLMLKMDHERTEAAMRAQFAVIDANRDGRISFDEFRAWMGADGR